MASPARSSPFTNFSWLVAERGWRVLLGLLVNVAVARHLGPAGFGALSYALGLVAIAGVLGGLGVDDVLARELVRDRARAGGWFAAGLRLKAVGALGAFVVLLGVAAWADDGRDAVGVVALAGAGLFFMPLDAVDIWFQARERMRPPALARQVALLVMALSRLALVGLAAPLWAFASAFAIEALLIATALGWLWVRDAGWPDWHEAKAVPVRRLLAEGWPLLVSGVLVVLALQADRLLLVWLAGDAAAGVYAAAARFTEVTYVLPMAAGAVLLPRLTALRQGDVKAYWQTARRAGWLLLAVGTVLAAGLSLGGAWILPRILGERYAASGSVLAVHAWTLVFVTVVSLRTRMLIIEGRSQWVLAMSAGMVLINLLGNAWLIPRWGASGAAWAAVGAWGCSALLLPWLLPGTRAFMRTWCGLAIVR